MNDNIRPTSLKYVHAMTTERLFASRTHKSPHTAQTTYLVIFTVSFVMSNFDINGQDAGVFIGYKKVLAASSQQPTTHTLAHEIPS